MEIVKIDDIYSFSIKEQKLISTLGSFDGIHRGHRNLLNKLELEKKINKDYKTAIFTFDILPKIYFKKIDKVLMCLDEKILFLEKEFSVDYLFVLNFENIKDIDAKNFLFLLKKNFNVEIFVIGNNHRLGKYNLQNTDIKEISRNVGINIRIENLITDKDNIISSSLIRNLLERDNLKKANILLGYNYFILGVRRKGRGRGRNIGFPTINIEPICKEKFILNKGVYFVYIYIKGNKYIGACNIGRKPTFNENNITIEVFVVDKKIEVEENEEVMVEFVEKIREEQKFNNIEELKQQINRDINKIKKIVKEV